MSITSGKHVQANEDIFCVDRLDDNIIINQTEDVWNCLATDSLGNKNTVDFVNDNAGYELFTDLILADYLLENKLAGCIRFHIKAIPWFISDAKHSDFDYTLKYLREVGSPSLNDLGKRWTQHVQDGKFIVMPVEHFWTSPFEYYKYV